MISNRDHDHVRVLARVLLRDYRLSREEREQEIDRLADQIQTVVDVSLTELEDRRGVELL